MNEQECLSKMIPPAGHRPSKPYRGGVIQIHITRACNLSCFGCTQGSQLSGKVHFMSPAHFEQALQSLAGYWGVVGVFGGNPAVHPQFETLCDLLCKYFPREQRGLWCNHPLDKASIMRRTFDPNVSNLNVHLDQEAFDQFTKDWPECHPVGLTCDSRHSPPWVAMKDLQELPANPGKDTVWFTKMPNTEENRWKLISDCDINKHWSAMIGVFRGELRAWFCEIAGAQSILHQDDPDYPDTGIYPGERRSYTRPDGSSLSHLAWWELPMQAFASQVRKHCHECGVPLRGHGELAQASDQKGVEQVSATHMGIYKPKRKGRAVELVTLTSQLGEPLERMTDYLGNSKR